MVWTSEGGVRVVWIPEKGVVSESKCFGRRFVEVKQGKGELGRTVTVHLVLCGQTLVIRERTRFV